MDPQEPLPAPVDTVLVDDVPVDDGSEPVDGVDADVDLDEPAEPPTGPPPWTVWVRRVVTVIAVGGAALFILLQLQPGLLVAHTTPAGGDMGAHVWGPAFLRDHVLPHGRLTGWANDWYAGFPAYHFYFPLPNLLIVVADLLLPYGVAFKLVSVSGLVGLPVAAWACARMLRLPFPAPELMAVSTVLFVFDRFHTIWGGNAAATLAGEFSFSIGLAFALLFVGVLARALDTGRGRSLAAALLAATVLCHLLTAAFAVAAACVLVLLRRPDRARWRLAATVGALGVALAAFWLLPFVARLRYSNDMGWERTQEYLQNLFPWLRHDDAAPHAATVHLEVVMPLALLGAVLAVARRRRGGAALTGIALAMATAFVLVPRGPIWNARLLPFWYLACYLLAAYAIAELCLIVGSAIAGWGRDAPNVFALAAPVMALVVVLTVVGRPLGIFQTGRLELPGDRSLPFVKLASLDAGTNFVPAWAKWNYSGYERKPDYAEYREVVEAMRRIGKDDGCGRAMWEYEPELNRFGTPMALMLLPYWTRGCIGSMEGLFFESSATVPYHFLNQSELSTSPSRAMRDLPYRQFDIDEGVRHLQLMGVRYYMAISPVAQSQAAGNKDLRLLTTTTPRQIAYGTRTETRFWQVYEVADSPLVTSLHDLPTVVETGAKSKHGWLDMAVDWYQDSARWDVPLAVDGPAAWPRIDAPDQVVPRDPVRPVKVSGIRVEDDRIHFRVDRTGVPVLVRMSYFPNWRVHGAKGPYRVTPNFMVVVPTARDVELRYGWTGVDYYGWLTTLIGIAVAVLLARRQPMDLPTRRRTQDEDDDVEPWVDPFLPDELVAASSGSGSGSTRS
jgi:hypothetical protein